MTENEYNKIDKPRNFANWAENAVVSLCDECQVSHRSIATLFKQFNFDLTYLKNNDDAALLAVQLVELFAVVLTLKESLKVTTQQKDHYKTQSKLYLDEVMDLSKVNTMLHNKITKLTKKVAK